MGFTSDRRLSPKAGFTIPEILVVVGVIALLIAVILPALTGAKRMADMASSKNNLRQIATWMTHYSAENREVILPSQFNYAASAATYPVKVRSEGALGALRYQGTWTDILWTINGLGSKSKFAANDMYMFDSPDGPVFDANPDYTDNPLRAAAPNSKDFPGGDGVPRPFGTGAQEGGLPGFFAANNFFNQATNPQTWWTTGQIRRTSQSMYLVDSLAGETIEPVLEPYDGSALTLEVDFRYSGACLMLFLDGHAEEQAIWTNLPDLESTRRIRVRNLHQN